MHCPAGLRVPVFCLLLVRLVCVCVYLCLYLGWVKWIGSRQMCSHLLQVPRNSSPKIGFDRDLPRSRG